jgi:hypothetical protein
MSKLINAQQFNAVFASIGETESDQLKSFPDAFTLLQWAMKPYYDDVSTKDRLKRKVVAELRIDVNGEPKEIISQEWMVNVAIRPELKNSQYAVNVASESFGCDTVQEATDYMSEDELTEPFGVFDVKLSIRITMKD